MTEKRFIFVGSGIEDNVDNESYLYNKDGFQDVCDLLNALHEENIKLRTLNYVNKEAVRLNNIKTVKIGREDVDCSNINWELLYELYNKMIDFYYDESGDLE